MAEFAKTQAIAAEKLGVSRASLVDWCRRPDFPKATKRGWNVDRIRAFAEKHGLGKSGRGKRGGSATLVDGVTLTEANIRLKVEQAENERIEKERQLVEQARELGEIVFASDVSKLMGQMVATITAVHDAVTDAVDRAAPEAPPSAEAWPEIRQRLIAICEKVKLDASSAMQELL